MVAAQGVYAPQEDSRVLTDVLEKTGLAIGRRIADLCTGSGVVAITAAALGASSVTACDICPRAVRCARVNAVCAGVDVDVHLESWARAVESRRSTSSSAIRRTCRMIRASTMRCRGYDRTGARMARRIRRATGARSGLRGRARPAGGPRQPAARAVRIRRPAAHPCRALQRRTGRQNGRTAMYSVRADADIARLVARRDRSSRSRPRGGAARDQGRQAMTTLAPSRPPPLWCSHISIPRTTSRQADRP